MKNNKLTYFLGALPIIIYAFIFTKLPEKIPMHFDFAGNIDRYGSKFELLFLTLIPLLIALLFDFLPKMDPKKQNYIKFDKFYSIFKLIMVIFFDTIFVLTIISAFNVNIVKIDIIIPILIGILFIFIGNYMPQTKQNYFLGVKTPWTLASETVWNKTHRLAGYTFILSGILMFLCAFTNKFTVILFTISIIICVFLPVLMSYVYYKKEQN